MLKRALKLVVNGIAVVWAFPSAMLCGFGRLPRAFQFFAQAVAQMPGLPGDYLRSAFYYLTLEEFSLHSRICFGSFFAQSATRIGDAVYIGSYCVIGSSH